MKPRATLFLLFLFCLFSMMSCYKVEVEANDLPQGYSVAQIIGTWKITAISSDEMYDWDGNGTTETNIYNTWQACQKDNLYRFNSNYTGLYKLSCSTTQEGTWYLDGTVMLVWNVGGQTSFEKITSLSSGTMETETSLVVGGRTHTINKTWTLQ